MMMVCFGRRKRVRKTKSSRLQPKYCCCFLFLSLPFSAPFSTISRAGMAQMGGVCFILQHQQHYIKAHRAVNSQTHQCLFLLDLKSPSLLSSRIHISSSPYLSSAPPQIRPWMECREREMEMGSSSLATSGASASTDSLNGLKFGKKIYFEDVGVGVPAKAGTLSGFSSSSSSSTSSSPATAPEAAKMVPRKGRGVVQGGQPPRCQVEGCKVDLTGAKPYYCKHKVCGMHSKSPKVTVNGQEQRFCQQCSRFHQLPEFDQGKRSCRRRLAGHNERRRKPPLMSFTSRNRRLSSSFPVGVKSYSTSLTEDISRVGGFPMDFTYIRSAGREVWPSVRVGEPVSGNQSPALGRIPLPFWKGHIEVPPANFSTHGPEQYLQGLAGVNAFANLDIPSSECFAGISNSSCALSLLSSQPWGPRNRASGSITANDFMNHEGSTVAPPSHSAMANNFMSSAGSFKGQEASSSSHGVTRELGLGETVSTEFSGQLYSTRQGSKQYMDDHEQHRQYGSSSNQIHWSL